MLLQLRHFWNTFQTKLADKNPYTTSIGGMRLRLAELQESDEEAQKLRAIEELQEGWADIDRVLHYQELPFVPKIIWTELISWHHNNPLAKHFGFDKTKELIDRKYYWLSLRKDVEAYVKGCDVYLALKAVGHKLYRDLQALPDQPTDRKTFQ